MKNKRLRPYLISLIITGISISSHVHAASFKLTNGLNSNFDIVLATSQGIQPSRSLAARGAFELPEIPQQLYIFPKITKGKWSQFTFTPMAGQNVHVTISRLKAGSAVLSPTQGAINNISAGQINVKKNISPPKPTPAKPIPPKPKPVVPEISQEEAELQRILELSLKEEEERKRKAQETGVARKLEEERKKQEVARRAQEEARRKAEATKLAREREEREVAEALRRVEEMKTAEAAEAAKKLEEERKAKEEARQRTAEEAVQLERKKKEAFQQQLAPLINSIKTPPKYKGTSFDGKLVEETAKEFTIRDIPQGFSVDEFEIHQKPVLNQRRSAEDQTNLCGYYALFNAESLAKNQPARMMNRATFAAEFKPMLELIAQNVIASPYRDEELQKQTGLKKYDNLEIGEIKFFLDQKNLLNQIFFAVDPSWLANPAIRELFKKEALYGFFISNQLAQQQQLLANFQTKGKKDLIILYYIPVGAHYITVLAERPQPDNPHYLRFTIYDSLGVNYLDPPFVKDRIHPLYDLLIGKIPYWRS